jgi:hypothetical protein
VLVVVQ